MNNEAIVRLICVAALKLDAEDFKGFMRQCTDEFRYSIRTYSPELGKEMVWLEHGHKGMLDLFAMLPNHVRMKGNFKRHVSVYFIDRDDDQHAHAYSSVLLFHTDLDGNSKLFAVGQYEDLIETAGETPRFLERVVRLETRNLGPGVHVPI